MRVTALPTLPALFLLWQSNININPTIYENASLMEVVWFLGYATTFVVGRLNAMECRREMGSVEHPPRTEGQWANWRIARKSWAIHSVISIFGLAMAVGGVVSMFRPPSLIPPDFWGQLILLILVSGAVALPGLSTFVKRERALIYRHIENASKENAATAEGLAATALELGAAHTKEVEGLQSRLASSEAAREGAIDASATDRATIVKAGLEAKGEVE